MFSKELSIMDLDLIFEFLQRNRQFNHKLQENFYKSTLISQDKVENTHKIISLLYKAANTQSKPNIDELSKFYRFIWDNISKLGTFESFVSLLNSNPMPRLTTYESLYLGLSKKNGWGPKTSALFVKIIYHIHNGNYDKRLQLWSDAPIDLSVQDRIYLPVDRVIISIFNRLGKKNWNFNSINKLLSEKYCPEKIEIWDDLWFWGFITQKVVDKERIFEWNPNKYWALEYSDKSESVINEIKSLAQEFLCVLDKSIENSAATNGVRL